MIKKEIITGFLVGIVFTFLGVIAALFVFSFAKELSFKSTFDVIKEQDRLWALLALGAIPSQLAFFIFIRKKLDYRARGVVLATFIIAFTVYYLYFF